MELRQVVFAETVLIEVWKESGSMLYGRYCSWRDCERCITGMVI